MFAFILFKILLVSKPIFSWTLFAEYASVALDCDQQLEIYSGGFPSQELLPLASLCITIPHHLECVGIRCNRSKTDCQMLTKGSNPKRCFSSLKTMGMDKLLLKKEFIVPQKELGLIDLERGELVPASVQNVNFYPIPPINSTSLHIQYQSGILLCEEASTSCKRWSQGSLNWSPFKPLIHVHEAGTMNLLDGQPIIIGGREENNDHGFVEIFDPVTDEWTLGPEIEPKKLMASVLVNQTSIVIVGGFYDVNGPKDDVSILIKEDTLIWKTLANFPRGTMAPICGLLGDNSILCIGGGPSGQPDYKAYSLDLSSSDPTWVEKPMTGMDLDIRDGFIFQVRQELFCVTLKKVDKTRLPRLFKMDLSSGGSWWELSDQFTKNRFTSVNPYMMEGYKIGPP